MRGRLTIFLTIAVVLVTLAVLNAASYVRVEQESEQELRPDRSTTNAGPTGTRALFEYLEQTNERVSRWTQPPEKLSDATDAPTVFVVVGQIRRGIEESEAEAILAWVSDGGRLVIIDRSPNTRLLPTSDGWRVGSEIYESPQEGTHTEDAGLMTRGVPAMRPSQPTPFMRDVTEAQPSRFASRLHLYRVEVPPPQPVAGYGAPPPPAPTPIVVGPADVGAGQREEQTAGEENPAPFNENQSKIDSSEEQTANEDDEIFDEDAYETWPFAPVSHMSDWREGTGALLVDYPYGAGRIVVLSDPYMVSNAGLRLADNLFLATNILTGTGGTIAFDEYHQGYGAGRNELLAYFAGTPVLWMFAQGAAVVLALVWTRGRRFARPLPAPSADRRSKLEFVASMAELQERARAYDLAVENVYARTRRALARYGGTRADAPVDELAARVAARSGRDRAQMEKLLRDCEDSIAGERTTARRALALVRDLRALERELGLLMRSREIRQAGTRL